MDVLHQARLDKTVFSVASLTDESDEKQYWLAKSPYERLRALELMRQIAYGYDPSTERLQRVFEIAERPSNVEADPTANVSLSMTRVIVR
jgi:hypothetical protein